MKTQFFVFTLLLLLYAVSAFDRKDIEVVKEKEVVHIEVCSNDFSEEELIKAIKDIGFEHPHIVLAQAKVETGHFTSNIFKENNNLFGMKVAWNRPTTAIGRNRGHAVYSSWRESLLDYALYSAYYTSDKTEKELYTHLGRHYAEDPRYTYLLQAVVNREQLDMLF